MDVWIKLLQPCISTFKLDFSLAESEYETSPSNNRFVKPHVRRGLLPQVLEDLLSARQRAKNDLKNEQDMFR